MAQAQGQILNQTPLLYPAKLNKVRVLPQKFEYHMLDDDRILIGDIMIDSTMIDFQLIKAEGESNYRLKFTWPAGLLMDGQISIKNSQRKAFWNQEIDLAKVNVVKNPTSLAKVRNELATFISQPISDSMVDEMRLQPFMNFCVYREAQKTKIYLCSKELYIVVQDDVLRVRTRNSTEAKSEVEINGQIVGEHGMIILNKKTDTVAMHATTRSGAFLELETSRNDIDFVDATYFPEQKQIRLQARGGNPVSEDGIERLGPEEWRMNLPIEQPSLYLKGLGDIALKQEFLIYRRPPLESDRVYIDHQKTKKTYSSRLRFTGTKPTSAKLVAADENTEVENLEDNRFVWTLHNLKSKENNQRYLFVQNGGYKYVASHQVYRGAPRDFFIKTYSPFMSSAKVDGNTVDAFSATSLRAQVGLNYWLDSLLFVKSDWAQMHWGLVFNYDMPLLKKSSDLDLQITDYVIKYRFNPGIVYEDPSWGISFPVRQLKASGNSSLLYGVGVFASREPFESFDFFDWMDLDFNYFLMSTKADLKPTFIFDADMALKKFFNKTTYWQTGFGIHYMNSTQNSVKVEFNDWTLQAGLGVNF